MAFSDPSWQLPRYLSVADDAGLSEFFLPNLKRVGDGRLWRLVPNRKWHADQKGPMNTYLRRRQKSRLDQRRQSDTTLHTLLTALSFGQQDCERLDYCASLFSCVAQDVEVERDAA